MGAFPGLETGPTHDTGKAQEHEGKATVEAPHTYMDLSRNRARENKLISTLAF